MASSSAGAASRQRSFARLAFLHALAGHLSWLRHITVFAFGQGDFGHVDLFIPSPLTERNDHEEFKDREGRAGLSESVVHQNLLWGALHPGRLGSENAFDFRLVADENSALVLENGAGLTARC
jgi:hypothetical protein